MNLCLLKSSRAFSEQKLFNLSIMWLGAGDDLWCGICVTCRNVESLGLEHVACPPLCWTEERGTQCRDWLKKERGIGLLSCAVEKLLLCLLLLSWTKPAHFAVSWHGYIAVWPSAVYFYSARV